MINSRAKGARFENKLCAMIRKTFNASSTDCYRTPLSGGHQAYCRTAPGDILISNDLWERFPFVIEAKHRRNWSPVSFQGTMTKEHGSFFRHLAKDLKMSPHDNAKLLMVCSGNNTKIYAALRAADYKALGLLAPRYYSIFHVRSVQWIQLEFHMFLAAMRAAKAGGK